MLLEASSGRFSFPVKNLIQSLFSADEKGSLGSVYSLLRMGAAIYTALWDTGYYGRSRSLLNVMNPAGIELEKGTRLIQLVFFKLGSGLVKGYEGEYRGEDI